MLTNQSMFAELCSYENLYLAYLKARKGKRSKPGVATFEYHQERELIRLQDELQQGAWRPGKYHHFYIHEPKRRLIAAAPFRDRVVHHALCNLIEPLWEKRFIADSYANRLGKGTHRAILRCSQFARHYAYVLQCDIAQYFPSIDHAILREMLQRVIPDAQVMHLIDLILASSETSSNSDEEVSWFPGDDLWAGLRQRGLPIGNLTSQLWGNVYLNDFDHFVKRELSCRAYLRYVDDFLLFADSKRLLWEWRSAIEKRLAKLRLRLHPPQVYPLKNGIPFLGFRIYPTHRLLKRRKGVAYQRRLRHLYFRWLRGEIERKKMDASVQSWVAHVSWGDTWGLRRAILTPFLL